MNKVTEEALTNMIRRIEILESKILKISYSDSKETIKPKEGFATPGQLKFIRNLGGDPWTDMTKLEAGKEIDELKKRKEKKINEDKYMVDSGHTKATTKINEESKKLTKEEIEEIGEENLL